MTTSAAKISPAQKHQCRWHIPGPLAAVLGMRSTVFQTLEHASTPVRRPLRVPWLTPLLALYMLVVLLLDLAIELGVAVGVCYVVAVALAYFRHHLPFVWCITAASVLLVILGFSFSPVGGEVSKVIANRVLALLAIGVTAWFVTRTMASEARQLVHETELEQQVAVRTDYLARQSAELRDANAALERSNLELSRFAYVASHDLQTPLRAITSFLQLVQERYADHLDPEAADWICRTLESAARLKTLIDDLLAYSRVDSQPRAPVRVSLNEVCDEVVALLAEEINAKRGSVSREALPTVRGDRNQLQQLLRNLIENALKFHGPDPPGVHISCRALGDNWLLTVEDNGIGIAAEHQPRIFEMFRRLHGDREYPGNGIGLALSRRVVERHGGTLQVESQPGGGSRFSFSLPRG